MGVGCPSSLGDLSTSDNPRDDDDEKSGQSLFFTTHRRIHECSPVDGEDGRGVTKRHSVEFEESPYKILLLHIKNQYYINYYFIGVILSRSNPTIGSGLRFQHGKGRSV